MATSTTRPSRTGSISASRTLNAATNTPTTLSTRRRAGSLSTTMPTDPFTLALTLIDAAHSLDPNLHYPKPPPQTPGSNGQNAVLPAPMPYELHYAYRMTHHLHALLDLPAPGMEEAEVTGKIEAQDKGPSQALQLAIRAQHFRRWETPRDSFPMTRIGYHAWRTQLKKLQASQVEVLLLQAGYRAPEAARVASLIRKEGLKPPTAGKSTGDATEKGGDEMGKNSAGTETDEEAQILEDVACLVFLEDQFEGYVESGGLGSDEKVVGILQRTWRKMSKRAQDVALEMAGGMDGKARELLERALGPGDGSEDEGGI